MKLKRLFTQLKLLKLSKQISTQRVDEAAEKAAKLSIKTWNARYVEQVI